MKEIKVHDEMLEWIKLQRGKDNTIIDFIRDARDTFHDIYPYLPSYCESILDIGCGLAAVPMLLYHHYGKNIHMFLLDSFHRSKKIYYGYHETTAFYNDPNMTRKFLLDNDTVETDFTLLDVKRKLINLNSQVDLITSFWSWGFHYPIKEYLSEVWRLLNYNGTLITMVRKGTGGREALSEVFEKVNIIKEYQKAILVTGVK
jgi:SAM-dependent methyltransferase